MPVVRASLALYAKKQLISWPSNFASMICDSIHKRYLVLSLLFPQDNIETEYKFARAQLWADYIGDGVATLPPPLNLIPSPKSVARWACKLTNRCFGVPEKLPCFTNVS